MSTASISLVALFVAIVMSCFTRLNIGVLGIVLAWIVGVGFGGMKLDAVIAGFPVSLFLTLVSVTLFFTQAQVNGTLDRVAHRAVRLCRGNVGWIPVMFFLVGLGLASMGPGNIAGIALLAPLAMAAAYRANIPPFLMAIMAGNGANAGALSPFAPTGVIASGLMTKIGLGGYEWRTYAYNAAAHALVGFGGYFAFGGWKLFRMRYEHREEETAGGAQERLTRHHWMTLGVIFALILGVLLFHVNVGMGALAGALILPMLGAADHTEAVKRMPWNVILMVTGVTVLIAIMEKTQGLQLFSGSARASGRPAVGHRGGGVRSRADLRLRKHVGCFILPDLPANGAGVSGTHWRRCGGACAGVVHQCRRPSGGCFAAFHNRGLVHRVRNYRRAETPVQPDARVGAFHGHRRGRSLLSILWVAVSFRN